MRETQPNYFCDDYIQRCKDNFECQAVLNELKHSCDASRCPGSIAEMQTCATKQREVIQFMKQQSPENTRFFDCQCKDGGINCDSMPVLRKNFHDCDSNSDSWSYECDSHYKSCIDQNNAIECGIPLLNISISCHIDNGTCDREGCISAVGQFFFANGGNFEFTSNLFKCCEHEHKCTGYPAHIYSPWECLQSDPFYSCNQVFKECNQSNDGCIEAYEIVEKECPPEILDPMSSECPVEKITHKCRENAEHLEGWYCSCKNEYEYAVGTGNGSTLQLREMSEKDIHSCLKYHRIFTHNQCLKSTRDGYDVFPTESGVSSPKVPQPPHIQLVSIICCAVLGSTILAICFYCVWKLRRTRSTYLPGNGFRNGGNSGPHIATNRSLVSNGSNRNGATENLISFSDREPTTYTEVEKESHDTHNSEIPIAGKIPYSTPYDTVSTRS